MRLLTLFGVHFCLDEQIILTLLAAAIACWVHAANYTAAESAHPTMRWAFRRSADTLAVVAFYVVLRVWV